MSETNKELQELAKNTTDDFYALLGVAVDASEAVIMQAYRKTSIRYHPDKNPDNKDAADRFIYLGRARDILKDAKLRSEYDRARAQRREKVLQDDRLDSTRRKMKEDLEQREQIHRDSTQSLKRKRAEDMSEAERIAERIAEDGRRRVREAQERLDKKRKEEAEVELKPKPEGIHAPQPGDMAELDRAVKVRFQREGETLDWDKERITTMFAKYGRIDSVVMGKDKKTRPSGEKHRKVTAVVFVIYDRLDHAHRAVSNGKADYPALESTSWAREAPIVKPPMPNQTAPSTPVSTPTKSTAPFGPGIGNGTPHGTPRFSFSPKTPSLEEYTMIRLQQAEKRRLEDQIRKEEALQDQEEAEHPQ
jgi:DnaJ family protein C protein 17